MAAFATVADARAYLGGPADSGQFTTAIIGSNIVVASAALQRMTHRQFEAQVGATKTFSTEGRANVTIPDLESATAVTLNSSSLTANSTYYLIPDGMNSGVHTGIQFRAFGRYDYRSNPEWFDRNLDSPRYLSARGSLPNDLVIDGHWGHIPYPDSLLHNTIVLAGHYVLRSDALLSGAINRIEQGVIFDMSALPHETRRFVEEWKIGPTLVAT